MLRRLRGERVGRRAVLLRFEGSLYGAFGAAYDLHILFNNISLTVKYYLKLLFVIWPILYWSSNVSYRSASDWANGLVIQY
jgi:hypothetical protein